jgi:ComF family protein
VRALERVLDLFFPPRCPFCGRVLDRPGICAGCESSLPWTGEAGSLWELPGALRCAAPLWYEGAVRQGLLRFKFQGAAGAADPLGGLIAQCAAERLSGEFDAVTWVPVSRKRLRRRGYDQAELLARSACRRWDTRPERLLEKTRDNPAQSGLTDREARRENVKGAYRAAGDCRGRRVLLVDDICTTGATLGQCAAVLLDAGAEAVVCAAAARTPPGRPDASDEELF